MRKGRRESSLWCCPKEKGLIKLGGASLIKENHYSSQPGNRVFWSIKYVVNSYLPLQQIFVETPSVPSPGSLWRPPDPLSPAPFLPSFSISCWGQIPSSHWPASDLSMASQCSLRRCVRLLTCNVWPLGLHSTAPVPFCGLPDPQMHHVPFCSSLRPQVTGCLSQLP